MRWGLVLAAAVSPLGCSGPVDPIMIERSVDVPVEGGDYDFVAAIDPPTLADLDFSQEHELIGRGISLADIERVTVQELSVKSRSADEDLHWFSTAQLRMRAPESGTRTVAEIDEFPAEASQVWWEGEQTDVTTMVTSGSTTIWLDLRGDAPPEDTQIRVDFALMVQTR